MSESPRSASEASATEDCSQSDAGIDLQGSAAPQTSLQQPDKSSSSSDSEADDAELGTPSPDCVICLGRCKNKCFVDPCMHQFCFKCLCEWSKVKAECPLCKQALKLVIHKVKSFHKFEEHQVQPPTVETRNHPFVDVAQSEILDRYRELYGNSFSRNIARGYLWRSSPSLSSPNRIEDRLYLYIPGSCFTTTFSSTLERFIRQQPMVALPGSSIQSADINLSTHNRTNEMATTLDLPNLNITVPNRCNAPSTFSQSAFSILNKDMQPESNLSAPVTSSVERPENIELFLDGSDEYEFVQECKPPPELISLSSGTDSDVIFVDETIMLATTPYSSSEYDTKAQQLIGSPEDPQMNSTVKSEDIFNVAASTSAGLVSTGRKRRQASIDADIEKLRKQQCHKRAFRTDKDETKKIFRDKYISSESSPTSSSTSSDSDENIELCLDGSEACEFAQECKPSHLSKPEMISATTPYSSSEDDIKTQQSIGSPEDPQMRSSVKNEEDFNVWASTSAGLVSTGRKRRQASIDADIEQLRKQQRHKRPFRIGKKLFRGKHILSNGITTTSPTSSDTDNEEYGPKNSRKRCLRDKSVKKRFALSSRKKRDRDWCAKKKDGSPKLQ